MIDNLLYVNASGGNDNGYPDDDFLGEVTAASFITGPALATAIGLTWGVEINTEVGWLRFLVAGKQVWVAKRPFRYQISWNNLNDIGCALGTKTISFGGKTYKVRLIRAAEADPSAWDIPTQGQDNPAIFQASEWNRLILRVSANNPGPAGNWAAYTDADLGVASGAGARSLGMERIAANPGYNVGRGFPEARWVNYQNLGDGPGNPSFNNHGWRPVLELVG